MHIFYDQNQSNVIYFYHKNNELINSIKFSDEQNARITSDKVVGEEWLLEDRKERFRDVHNGHDGNLYAITDSGKLYKISKK